METTRCWMSRDDTSWQDEGLPTTPRLVALVEGGYCIFKKHIATDPNATSLSTRQPERHTWWDDTKCSVKLGSCRSESMCTQLRGMTEMTRQDSMICASDLRSGMSDGQLVLLHRQISTDPHGTCIGKMITVETWLKGLTWLEGTAWHCHQVRFQLRSGNRELWTALDVDKNFPRRSRKSPNTETPSKALQGRMDF